jgi:hypothetical protein
MGEEETKDVPETKEQIVTPFNIDAAETGVDYDKLV